MNHVTTSNNISMQEHLPIEPVLQQKLLLIRILYIAFAVTPFLFLTVLTVIYTNSPAEHIPVQNDFNFINTLSLATFFFSLTCYACIPLIKRVTEYKRSLTQTVSRIEPSLEETFRSFLKQRLFLIALLENTSLFGLVVCFFALQRGVLYVFPVYWLNSIPVFILVAYIAMSFPTLQKIREWLIE